MTGLVIVADDLTGAADSVVPFISRGVTAVVVDAEGEWPADAAVLAIDTDSRHRHPSAAAERAAAATRRARLLGAEVVKKVDSTLRGNLARELVAMREVLTPEEERLLMVVAPAFPGNGRTTRDGVVHVDGHRLAAHWGDGDVVALLESGGLRARAVPAAGSIASGMRRAHADGLDAAVVDVETDADLDRLVVAAREVRFPLLLVGSGGLTRSLAGPGRAPRDVRPAGSGGTLVVVGSPAEASRRQRERLLEQGIEHVVLGDPDVSVARLRTALASGPALFTPEPTAPIAWERAAEVAAALAGAVTEVLGEVGTLVVTGGETARAVLVAAGVSSYLVTGEIEPGIVRGHVPELGIDLVTKSGGFGDAGALSRCLPPTSRVHRTTQEGRTR